MLIKIYNLFLLPTPSEQRVIWVKDHFFKDHIWPKERAAEKVVASVTPWPLWDKARIRSNCDFWKTKSKWKVSRSKQEKLKYRTLMGVPSVFWREDGKNLRKRPPPQTHVEWILGRQKYDLQHPNFENINGLGTRTKRNISLHNLISCTDAAWGHDGHHYLGVWCSNPLATCNAIIERPVKLADAPDWFAWDCDRKLTEWRLLFLVMHCDKN